MSIFVAFPMAIYNVYVKFKTCLFAYNCGMVVVFYITY